jgi:alpha-beta hydrolase superfamily lysophospholipase
MHTKTPPPPSTQIAVPFTSGAYRLHGTLHRPAGYGPFSLVIGSHGLLATGDSAKQIALADLLARQGIAYFRFDHRGCGRSAGDLHTATTFKGRCQDLTNAARKLLQRSDLRRPLALFGSSFGGAVCLGCAQTLNAAAIVTLAAPIASEGIDAAAIEDLIAAQPYPGALDREGLRFDLSTEVKALSNLMIVHGTADRVVPFDNAVRLHAAARKPKMLLELPGGDHRISDQQHWQLLLDGASEWIKAAVRQGPQAPPRP